MSGKRSISGCLEKVVGTTKLKIEYWETGNTKPGRGNRAIKLFVSGIANSVVIYDIDKNPHNNPAYNTDQKGFYETMATAISINASFSADQPPVWPDEVTGVYWENDSYALTKTERRY